MPSSAKSHARSHALLLLQKLLNLRDSASPLTLVLDTLEQSARPIIHEFLGRAKVRAFARERSMNICIENYLFVPIYTNHHTGPQKQSPLHILQHAQKAPGRRRLHQSVGQISRGAACGDNLALSSHHHHHHRWTRTEGARRLRSHQSPRLQPLHLLQPSPIPVQPHHHPRRLSRRRVPHRHTPLPTPPFSCVPQ